MSRILFLACFLLGTLPILFSQTPDEILPDLNEPNDLILVGDDLYFIERNTIHKVDLANPPFVSKVIVSGIERGAGLAVKDGFLYATDFDRGLILKVDITNNEYPTEILIRGLQTPDMLAIDGDILYYTDPNANLIGRVNLTTANPQMQPLLRNAGRAIGIAIYDNLLFYTDQENKTVNRIDLSANIPVSSVIFSNLFRPQGLSKCGSEIYLCDDRGASIWKFNPSCSANELEIVIENADTPRQTAITNNFLYTMAVDSENISRISFFNSVCYIDRHIICESETLTWLDGITYSGPNNTASITLQNTNGCDSIVTLNLTINNTDTEVTTSGGTLTATETNASYQWLNCKDNFGTIFGATSSTFSPQSSGVFAVEITKNGCVDTSDCFRVSITSTNDLSIDTPFEIYPNPTSEMLTINFEKSSSGHIEVFTLAGKLVHQYPIRNDRTLTIPLAEPAGVYFVKIQLGELSWTERILKI